jgi:hypothetical protein
MEPGPPWEAKTIAAKEPVTTRIHRRAEAVPATEGKRRQPFAAEIRDSAMFLQEFR